MKVTLQGETFGFSGKIKGYTKSGLIDYMRDQGAGVSNASPNRSMSCFLVGDRAAEKKIDAARALGLTLIEGDDLYALLEHGEVTLTEAAKLSLDDLIGSARALLAKTPSHAVWLELMALVDTCDEEHIEALIAYILPQTSRWPSCVLEEERTYHERQYGEFGFSAGDVRTFPGEWLARIVQGDTHPKYALCTALTFSNVTLSSSLAVKVFDNDAISHITTFDTGRVFDAQLKTRPFYKKMAGTKNLQNVRTLMLDWSKKGVMEELLTATSLPNLEALYLRPDVARMPELDHGAALFFGPWASQLKTVGVSHVRHLEVLAERRAELPSLEKIAIQIQSASRAQVYLDMATQLERLAASIQSVSLGINSHLDYGAYTGAGNLLDALSKGDTLTRLDLSSCTHTGLDDGAGMAFIQAHLIDNGLVDHLDVFISHPRISAEVIARLQSHGVEVIIPGQPLPEPSSPTIEDAPTAPLPQSYPTLATGEVCVEDALRCQEPGEDSWSVVVSVVDGLEAQGDGAAFEQAVATLVEHVRDWDDSLRVLPLRWLDALFIEERSPKLDLVRTLSFDFVLLSRDPRAVSRFIELLARAKHLDWVRRIHLDRPGKQKHVVAAMSALFEATPGLTSYHIGDPLGEKLRAAGVVPAEAVAASPSFFRRQSFAEMSVYEQRFVVHEVKTPEQMREVLLRDGLEHVVSLDLRFAFDYMAYPDGVNWGDEVEAVVGGLTSLEHLSISVLGYGSESLWRAIATWLTGARPVSISTRRSMFDPPDVIRTELLDAGLYERARSASISLPSMLSREELEAYVGRSDLRVGHLSIAPTSYDVPGIAELIEVMHPNLRESVWGLCWPTDEEDWSKLDEALEALPSLTLLAPVCPDFSGAARQPYLDHLASDAGKMAALPILQLLPLRGNPQVFSASEIKGLKKASGHLPDNLLIHDWHILS